MSANFRNPNFLLPNEVNMATNPALSEDRHSLYSMEFDGSSFIDISNDVSVSGDCTVSFWFRVPAIPNATPEVMFARYTGSSDTDFLIIGLYLQGVLASNRPNAAGSKTTRANVTLAANTWYHCAVTKVSGVVTNIYIDGTDRAGSVGSFEWWGAGSTNSGFIGQKANADSLFDGNIDEVAIFNTALTLSEVQALAKANAPANIMALNKKPIAYYPLGEQARDNTNWQFPNQVLQSHAFDFDGTDKIDISPILPLQGVSSFSISTWVYWDGHGSASDQWIFMHANDNNSKRIQLEIFGSDLYFQLLGSGGGYARVDMPQGKWVNLLCVFNGSEAAANRMIVYIDGQRATNVLYVAPTMTTTKTDYTYSMIGGDNRNFNFDGKLSNVAVWNSDQSSEKDNIYNNGSPASSYTNTPTAWYKLNATNTYAGLNPNYSSALSFISSQADEVKTGVVSISDDYSISGWFKWDNSATYNYLWDFRDQSADNPALYLYNNTLILYINQAIAFTSSAITQNGSNWYNLTLTKSGTTYTAYANGVSLTSATVSNTFVNSELTIGNRSTSVGTTGLDGSVSNLAIFNQAISAEDIKYLYNGGTPQTNISFEPVSWWKLDNLTTGIQDSGSASNNGTNNGATEVTDSVAVNQWNFNNVAHAQTPAFTNSLQYNPSGSGQYSLIPFSPNKTIEAISIWYNSTAAAGTNQQLISFVNSFSTYSALGLSINATGYGDIMFTQHWPAPFPANYTTYNGGEPTGWNNLVINYNTGTGKYDMYLNGSKLSTTVSGGDATDKVSTNGLLIGNRGDDPITYDGFISNVCIFDSSLNATGDNSIKTIYNNGTPLTSMSSFTSLDGWWTLKDTSTSVGGGLYDSSSNSNNASANTASKGITNVATPRLNAESDTLPSTALVSSDLQFESPYSNFSLDFDGVTYIIIGSSTVLDNVPSNPYSFSFWFKGSTAGPVLIEKRAANNFVNAQYTIHLGSGYVQWYGGADGATLTQTSTTLTDNQWHHIVCVAESTTVNKIYVDGQLDVTSSANRINGLVTEGTFNIGANYTGAYRFNGNLDEAAIFSKALTQAEVSQVYNNGYAADLTSLSPVSWWRLGEDAYFVNNLITIPNQISGAPNGIGSGTMTSTLVANAPGSYASGVGTNLDVVDRKGEAPESSANSQSINMIPGDVHPYIPGYVPAQVNNIASMNFDGVNDYFDAGNPTELQFTGAFSVSFWMKSNATGNRAMVSKDNNASNPRAFSIERTNAYPGGYFVVYNGTTAHGVYVASSDANYINIGDNNWHNVVGVYTPSTSVALFVDGNFVKSNTTSIPAAVNFVNDNLNIGRRPQSGGINYFPGDIDEVAIFDYALSPKQIKQDIYNASKEVGGVKKTADLNNNSNLTAPVAWYRMGD